MQIIVSGVLCGAGIRGTLNTVPMGVGAVSNNPQTPAKREISISSGNNFPLRERQAIIVMQIEVSVVAVSGAGGRGGGG